MLPPSLAILDLTLALALASSSRLPASAPAWDFKDGVQGWTSVLTTPLEVRQGALFFRATGHDPILVSPPISLEPSPGDVVEIKLRSSVSGTAEIFWRSSFEGPYGGFSAALSRKFEVASGEDRQLARIRPFWHGSRPIITLRFDPPGGDGEFLLESIRVIDGPKGPGVPAAFDFRRGGGSPSGPRREGGLGWQLDPAGAPRLEDDGLHAELGAPGARLVSPLLDVDAASQSAVSIDATAPSDTSGKGVVEAVLEFAVAGKDGSLQRPFQMRPGQRGTYFISMKGFPGWRGKVAMILLGMRSSVEGELVLHSLRAVASAGVGMGAGARMGVTASAGTPPSSPAPGVPPALGPTTSPDDPPTGLEFQTGSWPLDRRLAVSPRRIDVAAESPPETRPVASDYTVAMWYFAAWEPEYKWDGWKQVAERAPWRIPLLHDSADEAMEFHGIRFHRSSHPRVIDWHVHWMREHAVSLILWDWYPGTTPAGEFDPGFFGNRALEVGFLGKDALGGSPVKSNRFRAAISFAVMWTNHPPFQKIGRGISEYICGQFFSQPNYYRLDGKPLLIIWWPRGFAEEAGGEEGARRKLDELRELAKTGGFPGVYIAGILSPSEISLARAMGLDGAMGYHYSGSGGYAIESRAAGDRVLQDQVEDFAAQTIPGHVKLWTEMEKALGRDYLLATTPMQNWEPTLRPTNLVMRGVHPDAYREMLRRALEFIEKRGLRRFVSVEAWNEWLEGSYVEPSVQWGTGWLEALRDVFGK